MSRAPFVSPATLQQGEQILGEVLRLEYPADAVLAREFRRRRALGSGERVAIAEAVFLVLRRMRTLEGIAGPDAGPRRLLLAAMARHPDIGAERLGRVVAGDLGRWVRAVAEAPWPQEPPAVAADLPDWLYDRLGAELGEAEACALAVALAQPAPLDLRVNLLKGSRDEALARLRADGFGADPCRFSPLGIRLRGKPSLHSHPLYTGGAVEIQDEGSQLVGLLVGARPREMVADFCAGAGGKTLLLGAAMGSTGRLYAFDVEPGRLRRLRPRARRAGLSNIVSVAMRSAGDARLKRLRGKLDRVLVDAPCTGLGTVRRNPDLKWKLGPESVAALAAEQAGILAAASALVKPGGRLVYATCSVLEEENRQVVEGFLAADERFAKVPASEALRELGVEIPDAGEFLQLWPHRHATDGFFVAVMSRRARNRDAILNPLPAEG